MVVVVDKIIEERKEERKRMNTKLVSMLGSEAMALGAVRLRLPSKDEVHRLVDESESGWFIDPP